MRIENICNHTFFGDYLSENSIVFDCGANNGDFSKAFREDFNCKIYGFEPDPRLFPRLPRIKNCKFYQLAISSKNEVLKLNLGNEQCSSLLYKDDSSNSTCEVNTIELSSFCKKQEITFIDVLKMDIEGSEIHVLKSLEPTFLINNIGQITVEFHEFLDKDVIPDIKEIIKTLKSNGFYFFQFSRTFGDVLFVNKKFIKLSLIQILKIGLYKYREGFSRILKRAI